jgi:hypothetical protein
MHQCREKAATTNIVPVTWELRIAKVASGASGLQQNFVYKSVWGSLLQPGHTSSSLVFHICDAHLATCRLLGAATVSALKYPDR